MAKGDRNNFERLLRSAWEIQCQSKPRATPAAAIPLPEVSNETAQPMLHAILRWSALAVGLLLLGFGVAAMYGDDYKIAALLYLAGLLLVLADFLALEQNRRLRGKEKNKVVIFSALATTMLFAL